MKKLTLFAMLLLSGSLLAQWPYFQQNHSCATTGIGYDYPVDAHYDGGSRVYSLHDSNNTGMIVVRNSTGSGALIDVTYLSRGNTVFAPVRIRTQGSYYYAQFNMPVSGVTRYCIAKINATTNGVVWTMFANEPTNTLDVPASDFIIDAAGTYAYVLGSVYDAVSNQSDPYVAKINVAALPTLVWSNTYQNPARDEYGSNIIIHNNELFASFMSYNPLSLLDRGPGLLKLDLAGNQLGTRIYKYAPACQPARSAGTWVMSNGNQLTLSSISYVGADGNGPLWLANIDPATLVFTLQRHHTTGAAYVLPEIQNVSTAAGNRILMSGAAPFVNTATPGYVHYYFDAATLNFTSGTKYPTTNPWSFGGNIFDTYISSGTGLNVFSVAQDANNTNTYHFLKTSDLGDNGCDIPVSISLSSCVMDHYTNAFTTVPTPVTLPPIKLFTSSPLSNVNDQACLVICPTCPPIDLPVNGHVTGVKAGFGETLPEAYPNPTTGLLTIDAADVSTVRVYTIAGALVNVPVRMTETGAEIDLSAEKEGIYIVEAMIGSGRRNWRIIKQ